VKRGGALLALVLTFSRAAVYAKGRTDVVARPASRARLTASAALTQKEDDPGRDDRASVEASVVSIGSTY
jgi:hypothetical protein